MRTQIHWGVRCWWIYLGEELWTNICLSFSGILMLVVWWYFVLSISTNTHMHKPQKCNGFILIHEWCVLTIWACCQLAYKLLFSVWKEPLWMTHYKLHISNKEFHACLNTKCQNKAISDQYMCMWCARGVSWRPQSTMENELQIKCASLTQLIL